MFFFSVLTSSVGVVRNTDTTSTGPLLLAGIRESLGKGGALAQSRALPVDDVDCDDEDKGDAEENGAGVFQVSATRRSNVGEEGNGGDGEHTSKEVTLPKILAFVIICEKRV